MKQEVFAQPTTATQRRSPLMLWLEGCGAGILIALYTLWQHISPLHTDLYHRLLPMNTVFGGVAIDFVIVCLLSTGALWLIQRFDAKGSSILWAVVAIILFKKMGDFAIGVAWQSGVSRQYFVAVHAAVIACSAAGPLLWLLRRSWYSRIAVPVFRGFLAAAGFCTLWVLPQLVYMAIRPEPHDTQKFARAVAPALIPRRRVIWILYDELSQDQVFDHRQPDISLPHLDKFRSRSVMFSDVRPAGFYTEDVLPSLLSGKILSGIRSDLSGTPSVKTSNRWRRFPVSHSIFADAKREQWSTGVAGWYVPYCRTYGQSLDWCAWVWRSNMPGNYSPDKSLWWNVNAPLLRAESKLTGRKSPVPSAAMNHAGDYTEIMRWSHELIDDQQIGFVFLHLPLPHPFGFYNRKTGQLGVQGTYLDNLALTDRSLGQIMQWISQTGLASQTTVIVCSDHSWRLPIWRLSLTKEEKAALGGKFDTRPVLMVHFPGENEPETVSSPFPAIREHAMVETMLRRPMTAAGLEDWAHRQ